MHILRGEEGGRGAAERHVCRSVVFCLLVFKLNSLQKGESTRHSTICSAPETLCSLSRPYESNIKQELKRVARPVHSAASCCCNL